MLKIHVPGKLILSGEHAVVYGNPALALAVKPGMTTTLSPITGRGLLLDLPDLSYRGVLTWPELQQIKEKIQKKYQDFICGRIRIEQVMDASFELAVLAFTRFLDAFALSLSEGLHLRIESSLPLGSGMGSSAATILSTMRAVSKHFNQTVSPEEWLELALEVENRQHGHSSGLDLRIVWQGGCGYGYEGKLHARALPDFPLYLINTGQPATTTGQCVEKVAPHFKSASLRQDFSDVTQAMDKAIAQHAFGELVQSIRNNHRLLSMLGVVPEKIRQLIAEIELLGGAAKICGAGAVAGDQAGVVWVVIKNDQALFTLCEKQGYAVQRVHGENTGAYAQGE